MKEPFCKMYDRMDEERISHVTLVVLCKDGFIVPITCKLSVVSLCNKVIPHVLLQC